ncbi:polysaccharide export outer membrane protein [Tahibacter aquaticus]|uniref:Polysaccharide export outer membrane protein n=1 Tax=Tahibacter aquaticus TaxID=520092 RepID=A0A4R6YMQ6_9GAMM|nr:polysaccharide biosynthesis/export family protein [Tahibacter aquaticus]TDR38595.1 polysaccharide export outer membrane protein [Tahibacter aquaticus]
MALIQRGRSIWRRWSGILILLSSAYLLSGCGAPNVRPHEARPVARSGTNSMPPPDSIDAEGEYKAASEYRIGANDLLEINVFQVEELARTLRVNTQGKISLPLIGSIDAGGMTVGELEREIASRLAQKYMQNPQVSIFVKEFTSQRVTVEGAVRKPGIYALTGKTSLLQALAMSEGLDSLANQQGIVIFRVIGGQKMGAVFDIAAIRAGRMEDPLIYGDDIVVVDQSGPRTALRRFVESLPVFALFRPF